MAVRLYTATNLQIVLAGITMTGLGEDDFFSAEFAETERTKSKSGAHGDISLSASTNKIGMMTIKLMGDSPSNRFISILLATGVVFPAWAICSENPNFKAGGLRAWVAEDPAAEFGLETGENEYVIGVADFTKVYL